MSVSHVMSIMKRKGTGPTLTIHFDKVSVLPYVDEDLLYASADWEAAANGLFEALVESAPPELLDYLTDLLWAHRRPQRLELGGAK